MAKSKKRKLVTIDGAYIYLSVDYSDIFNVLYISVGMGVFYFLTSRVFLPHGDINSLLSFKMVQYLAANIAYFAIWRTLLRLYVERGFIVLFAVWVMIFLGSVYYVSAGG